MCGTRIRVYLQKQSMLEEKEEYKRDVAWFSVGRSNDGLVMLPPPTAHQARLW
jgi:hypothetical protein